MSHRLSLIGPRGNTISVVAAGEGPALILLHGFPLDHRMWEAQLAGLSDRYQVIVPEFRGFGGSTLGEAAYRLADLADDVEVVRSRLAAHEAVTVCGLSMGGYVAFEYWRRHSRQLRRLVLANTKPAADDESAKAARVAMAERALAEGTWPAVSNMMGKLLGPAALAAEGDAFKTLESMMRSAAPDAVAAAQHAMADREDFVGQLEQICVRTLVLTGESDALAPPETTGQWAEKLPDARFEVMGGVGHMTPLESPGAFNTLLAEFLSESST